MCSGLCLLFAPDAHSLLCFDCTAGCNGSDLLHVLVKVNVRSSSDASSDHTGTLRKGSIFEVLDVQLDSVDNQDADDGNGSRLRVESAKGWVSTVSLAGVVLCEKLPTAGTEPKLLWDPVKTKAKARPESTLEPDPEPEANSDSTGVTVDDLTGIIMYNVKQGRSKLQLQVGTMGLQVFKGGKPIDNILFKDLTSWQVRCSSHCSSSSGSYTYFLTAPLRAGEKLQYPHD